MSRTFAVGDIHGADRALEQCLERCGFVIGTDKLITLGDICDGWPYVYECVELLLKIPDEYRVDVMGNHDEWLRRWLATGIHPDGWSQGGSGTARSYLRHIGKNTAPIKTEYYYYPGYGRVSSYEYDLSPDEIPETHKRFFERQVLYYKDDMNRLFVHAGFNPDRTLKENQQIKPNDFYWNRDLWNRALDALEEDYKIDYDDPLTEIFIGHTETTSYTRYIKKPGSFVLTPSGKDTCPPVHADIIWNLDTGAGSTGRLTIMDIDTHEYWQSDMVKSFYGKYKPRG